MPTRRRLDAELVRRGLVTSRTEAQRLITVGGVTVAGRPSARAATLVAPDDPIVLATETQWASRAGEKLAAGLAALGIDPSGRTALDVGASTGGFTDVLLAAGATRVTAVDVGYGQMVWRLRTDPRVDVHDRTNFRTVDVASLGGPFDVVVVDVSFISVTLLAANLTRAGHPDTDYVVLVKPQFEVGRGQVGKGGVIRDPIKHRRVLSRVVEFAIGSGLSVLGLTASPLRGPKGNREFFVHLSRRGESVQGLEEQISDVVNAG